MKIGIDVGSTTVKVVVLNEDGKLLFKQYQRHYADVVNCVLKVLEAARQKYDGVAQIAITGSAGMGLAEILQIDFVQEVIACTEAIEQKIPKTDVAIELGGEDAKITFFDGSLEQRMNGSCAGGTGAFIDQMAALLQTDALGLNKLAKNFEQIYPIASRCGVFAKTDVQPLINEGASRNDIAVSIFQAVVNQTIAGLASGRKIKGNVTFLGGPLTFLPELRNRFVQTLHLTPEQVIFPDDSQYFVAIGAAILANNETKYTIQEIIEKLTQQQNETVNVSQTLPPLFERPEDLEVFQKRHQASSVSYANLSNQVGPLFLGIDAGSTTSKVILINEEAEICYQSYGNNKGKPLESVIEVVKDIYRQLPAESYIAKSCVTGYGEHLIKHALKLDLGQVETIAHYKAANHFQPGVDFILDIGGQDMKAMTIRDGALSAIQLNEACSSGCGSFIETFAKSLNYKIEDFAKIALTSKHPVDLGSRCTVFMNSKVKQVQKEGASVADISAGLSYSVIKNALFKVIKVRKPEDLGEKIVCQGGTFYNDAVLRAFELLSGREVIRPSIAGLMGAFGCALIALENAQIDEKSQMVTPSELANFTCEKEFTHCGLCENNCMLTVTLFNDGRQFITGNRCERGAKIKIPKENRRTNLVDYKYRRLFRYRSLKANEAKYGTIGIPRVLNMYENYPLWHTIFTKVGFKVVLSPRSNKELFEKGIETIPSDTVCYPAKLVHGHIQSLIEQNVDRIFYPSVVFEQNQFSQAQNHFNCPIVQSYPEVIANNFDEIKSGHVDYRHPYFDLSKPEVVAENLANCFSDLAIPDEIWHEAVDEGFKELAKCRKDIQQKGEELLEKMLLKEQRGIVLAGRPYHLDPEIHHGIAEMMTQEGFHVLTEDSISHLGDVDHLRVVNQWMYHSRLYAAAKVVSQTPNLELVQLNSFGCGIDAVTTDQVQEILNRHHRLYTVLKIDEGTNLGAVRIRLRSLKAAVEERAQLPEIEYSEVVVPDSIVFTKEMRKKHTILLPMLSPIHQEGLLDQAFSACGYHVVSLPTENSQAIDVGLRFVNNDACYPAIISIGQLLEALQSGEYDLNNTSVMLTQTGGGCRATNYIPLLRKALSDAGFAEIPVISLSMGNKGVESSPGFKLTIPLVKRIALAAMYGDLFERVVYRTRPYEKNPGEVNEWYKHYLEIAKDDVKKGSFTRFRHHMKQIIQTFDQIELLDIVKPRVGVVGEILVKYSPIANNNIVELLESEGAEAVVPDLIGFMNYSLYNQVWRSKNLGQSKQSQYLASLALKIIEELEKPMHKELLKSNRFDGIASIKHLAESTQSYISIGSHTGEGWFLTGEMIHLLETGVNNIICMQPFGCLPNHVVGKGMLKTLRESFPQANITAIDYDPGISIVNQLNRIRLMLSTANKNLQKV